MRKKEKKNHDRIYDMTEGSVSRENCSDGTLSYKDEVLCTSLPLFPSVSEEEPQC